MIRRRRAVAAGAVVGVAGLAVVVRLAAPGAVERRLNGSAPPAVTVAPEAARVHAALTLVDLHADTLLWDRDLLERGRRGHADLPRLLEGNAALQVFSVVTVAPRSAHSHRRGDDLDLAGPLAALQGWPPAAWWSPRARALWQARRLRRACERSEGRLVPVRSVADLDALLARRAAGEAVVGGLLALEGLHPLEGRLEALDELHEAGFRMMGIAHFLDNEAGGSLHDDGDEGLTELGRRAVRRMEDLGVVVDLAHASPRTFEDVLAMARRPVVVSHAGVRGTCDSPRNLSDAQLRALAANGGVVGIAYFRGAACGTEPRAIARAVRHAVAVAGPDHVALGSDFDGAVRTAFDASGTAALTAALLEAGVGEVEIRKVAGGNALRVLRQGLPPR